MADPLDLLRTPLIPVEPDPTFAAPLRSRIERALALPRGVVVSNLSTPNPAALSGQPAAPTGGAIPYLAVRGAREAIGWYVDVLGARLNGDPIVMPDGRIGHSELEIAGGVVYLSEEHPEIGVVAPTVGAASVSLVLDVHDADATRARVLDRGGRSDREPYDDYGHRNAWVVDPFGHRWLLQGPLPETAEPDAPAEPMRQGDIAYVSLWTPDAERAARFYSAVLGWRYGQEESIDGRQVVGTSISTGIWGGQDRSTLMCCYAVDDVDQAVLRVRDAGGRASEPANRAYGRIADCVDDQATAFALVEAGAHPRRPPANGARQGDLGYVTLHVVDSARARSFYGAVLGWRFTPGRIAEGWGVENSAPMIGMSGGHDRGSASPMWRVDDIGAAVQRVRDAGGISTEPEQQPYGPMVTCSDDQGAQFYLGQL